MLPRARFTEETFKLDVPVEVLSERGQSIHQLAAKKAVAELEGRGWLMHAKDETGVLMKEKPSAGLSVNARARSRSSRYSISDRWEIYLFRRH